MTSLTSRLVMLLASNSNSQMMSVSLVLCSQELIETVKGYSSLSFSNLLLDLSSHLQLSKCL